MEACAHVHIAPCYVPKVLKTFHYFTLTYENIFFLKLLLLAIYFLQNWPFSGRVLAFLLQKA